MTMRILLAGIAGAIAMFAWSAIAHMVLPLGMIGVSQIPVEQPVLEVLRANLSESGLYMFPGMGENEDMEAAMRALEMKPSGILVYHPPGRTFSFPMALGVEFLENLIAVMIAVFLLMQTRLDSLGGRVGFFAGVGVIAVVTSNISYWNWYGFPTDYTMGVVITDFAGYVAAGIAAALLLPRSSAA